MKFLKIPYSYAWILDPFSMNYLKCPISLTNIMQSPYYIMGFHNSSYLRAKVIAKFYVCVSIMVITDCITSMK